MPLVDPVMRAVLPLSMASILSIEVTCDGPPLAGDPAPRRPLDQPVRSVFTSTGRTIVAPSIDETRRNVILIKLQFLGHRGLGYLERQHQAVGSSVQATHPKGKCRLPIVSIAGRHNWRLAAAVRLTGPDFD